MRRKEALYAVIGGIVGAVLTMLAGSFSPLEAQNEKVDVVFGKITCTELDVVDADGTRVVRLRNNGIICPDLGVVKPGEDMKGVWLRIDGNGCGEVTVFDHEEPSMAEMKIGEHGPMVALSSMGGKSAKIGIDRHGGKVYVSAGILNSAAMGVGEHSGYITVWGNTFQANGSAGMTTDEHGGRVAVWGKGDSKPRGVMHVNEHGNGMVSTFDKNGYRLETFK